MGNGGRSQLVECSETSQYHSVQDTDFFDFFFLPTSVSCDLQEVTKAMFCVHAMTDEFIMPS